MTVMSMGNSVGPYWEIESHTERIGVEFSTFIPGTTLATVRLYDGMGSCVTMESPIITHTKIAMPLDGRMPFDSAHEWIRAVHRVDPGPSVYLLDKPQPPFNVEMFKVDWKPAARALRNLITGR